MQSILQGNPVPSHCTWANHNNASLFGYCDGAFTSAQSVRVREQQQQKVRKQESQHQHPHQHLHPHPHQQQQQQPAHLTTSTLIRGGAPCNTNGDCQLNGLCSANKCACDAAWTGANCSFLFAMPSAGAAYPAAVGTKTSGAGSGSISSWGGRPVLGDDKKWHLYVAEFANSCGMNAWKNNSQVIHALSTTPEGPFERVGVVIPPFSHNPDTIRAADGTYVIFHIGAGNSTYKNALNDGSGNGNGNRNRNRNRTSNISGMFHGSEGGQFVDCSSNGNGTTPKHPAPAANVPFPKGYTPGAGIHVSKTPGGPFVDYVSPSFDGCNNAAAAVHPNGSIAVWCYSKPNRSTSVCRFQVYVTDAWGMPFRLLDVGDGTGYVHVQYPEWLFADSNGAIFTDDPTMWIDHRGNWHVLSHNGAGPAPCGLLNEIGTRYRDGNPAPIACGAHFYSADGFTWVFSPVAAYNASVTFADGTEANLYRQRPKVLLDPITFELTHLFTGVMHYTPKQKIAEAAEQEALELVGGSGSGSGSGSDHFGISGPPSHDFSWTMVVPVNTDSSANDVS